MVKVLVAIRPEDRHVMDRVFGEEFDVIHCVTLTEAKAALATDLALIGCGVHFDEGRMFDLLKLVKTDPAFRTIPFWGILRDDSLLSAAITRGIRTALKSMGASGLLNLSQLGPGSDEETAFRDLRIAIRKSLADKG